MNKNSLVHNIKLKYYDNRETKLYAFDTLLDMGELAESIQKKMQPKYDAVYGKGVIDFSVTRNDLHSISFTWKRNLKLPKKELIGIMDAELITGWKVLNTKPLEFVDSRPTQAKAGKVLLRSFAPRYKKLMKQHYELNITAMTFLYQRLLPN